MSAKMPRDLQYFYHIFHHITSHFHRKVLKMGYLVLSLKVTAFIILEKSRGWGRGGIFPLPPPFQIKPPKKPVLLRVKKNKGRGVVILDRTKYIDKCLSRLATKQFSKLNYDPTSKLESKVQRTLRKIKSQQDLTLVNSMRMQKYTNFQLITQMI